MQKLTPSIQATPVTDKTAENVSSWYTTQVTAGVMTAAEAAWLTAQGWLVTGIVTSGGQSTYFFRRKVIQSEQVLGDLVDSYTEAYNEGRTLNDQRYDDIVTLWTTVLDRTEDSYNTLETDDDTYETLIETIIGQISSDYTSYDTEINAFLDDWGDSLTDEVNARFDALLSQSDNDLITRGLYSSAHKTIADAGIERERTRALNDVSDRIALRQQALIDKLYADQANVRLRLLEARERLRNFLHGARERQVSVRNALCEQIAGIIERRSDSYPDLNSITSLAASLGAGSAEMYAP